MLQVDGQKVNRSLLKTSYIITFSKFGYIFLLDNFYHHIRSEIDNLDHDYTGQIFVPNQLTEKQVGTFYINNTGAESILNVFALNTKYSDTIIGSIFPFPGSTPELIQYSLTGNGERVKDGILVQIDTNNYDNTVDLFSDREEIVKIHSWVYQFLDHITSSRTAIIAVEDYLNEMMEETNKREWTLTMQNIG